MHVPGQLATEPSQHSIFAAPGQRPGWSVPQQLVVSCASKRAGAIDRSGVRESGGANTQQSASRTFCATAKKLQNLSELLKNGVDERGQTCRLCYTRSHRVDAGAVAARALQRARLIFHLRELPGGRMQRSKIANRRLHDETRT